MGLSFFSRNELAGERKRALVDRCLDVLNASLCVVPVVDHARAAMWRKESTCVEPG